LPALHGDSDTAEMTYDEFIGVATAHRAVMQVGCYCYTLLMKHIMLL
jgi:hypothetical protein